jgi:lysozyme family protein
MKQDTFTLKDSLNNMDYQQLYDLMVINPEKIQEIDNIISKIKLNKYRYTAVSLDTNVPANIIAAIHYRESGMSFNHHQHNGDPLTARTVHVPKGRPLEGEPPFTWEHSAIDAFKMMGWDKITDWSMPAALSHIEAYNGLGYKKRGLSSPYLWSWSSNYHAGKYVADGKFDPDAVDQQCGAAVLLKLL